MIKLFLILSLLLFASSCEKNQENKVTSSKNEINFCSLVSFPEKYESKIIQTKAVVLGFHTFIFYSGQCLEQDKSTALAVSYESRRKIFEVVDTNKTNYKTSFLNNNIYAEIEVLGELKENDEKELEVFHPRYKFFVNEIKNVNILSEEIFPNDKAIGAKIVK